MLQSMGSQRVRYNGVTEQQVFHCVYVPHRLLWHPFNCFLLCCFFPGSEAAIRSVVHTVSPEVTTAHSCLKIKPGSSSVLCSLGMWTDEPSCKCGTLSDLLASSHEMPLVPSALVVTNSHSCPCCKTSLVPELKPLV